MDPLRYGTPNKEYLHYMDVINGPKWSAIETCTYLISDLRTPLYSYDPAQWSYCIANKLYNNMA